jgi:hypothetical protein
VTDQAVRLPIVEGSTSTCPTRARLLWVHWLQPRGVVD